MKNTTKLLSVTILSVTFFLSACKKEETSSGSGQETIIKGNVYAELDLTAAGMELVPGLTKLTVLVDPNDLQANTDDTLKVDEYRYPATVGADGSYSVKVPARNKGTKVKIIGDDFVYQQKVDPDPAIATVRNVYRLNENPEITVYRGTTKVLDVSFTY